MARLLVDGRWYDPVQPDAVYESDLEDIIIQNAATIYPEFWMVRYKRVIQSEFGTAIPDLALVEKRYRSWYICEVELGSHDLHRHVKQQIAVFCNARVGEDEANYLAQREEQFDVAQLSAMMRGVAPGVLVIVNAINPHWRTTLSQWGAKTAFLELYRSRDQRLILRLNGDDLAMPGALVSECVRDPIFPRGLRVSSPAPLTDVGATEINLWYGNGMTTWRLLNVRGATWLLAKDRFPLSGRGQRFEILKAADNTLILSKAGK